MPINRILSERQNKILIGALILSVGGCVLAGRQQDSELWPALLVNVLFFLTLILGSAVFVAIQHVSNAGWSAAIRRAPETIMRLLPLASVLLLVVTFFGRATLYSWVSHPIEVTEPALRFKAFYLTPTFFFFRMIVFLSLWNYLVHALLVTSRRQDIDGAPAHTERSRKLSAVFLVAFGLTLIPASVDWLCSLEPMFYSTIYVLYVFSGLFLGGFAGITIVVILLKRFGFLPLVHEGHLHSLRKLVFAFATFWAYIWLSQYLLIYYANLPDETVYYAHRMSSPGWKWIFLANLFVSWVIPFLILMRRNTRANEFRILLGCLVVLAGHWLDLVLLIMPVFVSRLASGIGSFAATIGIASIFVLAFAKLVFRAQLSPEHDPYMEESLWKDPYEASVGVV